MTDLQKKILNLLQTNIPLIGRPFTALAQNLSIPEFEFLTQARHLQKTGLIRRITPSINQKNLGKQTTLVTAHIAPESLDRTASAINDLPAVSHNYLRHDHYNLWFTLQADTPAQIEQILTRLSTQLNTTFQNLPAERFFKLSVIFDAFGNGILNNHHQTTPQTTPVQLNPQQKLVLTTLQKGIELTEHPFAIVPDLSEQQTISTLQTLTDKHVIRNIRAVADHRKLGYTANALLIAEVPENNIENAAAQLTASPLVSHCYLRKTFENWPYNLYAMTHSPQITELESFAKTFASKYAAKHKLLKTVKELKKKPTPISK